MPDSSRTDEQLERVDAAILAYLDRRSRSGSNFLGVYRLVNVGTDFDGDWEKDPDVIAARLDEAISMELVDRRTDRRTGADRWAITPNGASRAVGWRARELGQGVAGQTHTKVVKGLAELVNPLAPVSLSERSVDDLGRLCLGLTETAISRSEFIGRLGCAGVFENDARELWVRSGSWMRRQKGRPATPTEATRKNAQSLLVQRPTLVAALMNHPGVYDERRTTRLAAGAPVKRFDPLAGPDRGISRGGASG